jgi:hypothetical protein
MLHHWDPQISYTRMADMEAFFEDSDIKAVVQKNRSTYIRTFISLTA